MDDRAISHQGCAIRGVGWPSRPLTSTPSGSSRFQRDPPLRGGSRGESRWARWPGRDGGGARQPFTGLKSEHPDMFTSSSRKLPNECATISTPQHAFPQTSYIGVSTFKDPILLRGWCWVYYYSPPFLRMAVAIECKVTTD
jgi:hypothetical protein